MKTIPEKAPMDPAQIARGAHLPYQVQTVIDVSRSPGWSMSQRGFETLAEARRAVDEPLPVHGRSRHLLAIIDGKAFDLGERYTRGGFRPTATGRAFGL